MLRPGDRTTAGSITTVVVVPLHKDSDGEDSDSDHNRPLLPPEDRIWRHPSELSGVGTPAPNSSTVTRLRLLSFATLGLVIAALTAGALLVAPGLDEPADDSTADRSPGPETSSTLNSNATNEPVFGIRVRRGSQWVNGNATVFRRDGVLLTTRRLVVDADDVVVDLGPMGELTAQVMGTDAHADTAVLSVDVSDLGRSARWSDDAVEGPVSIAGLDDRRRRASIRGAVSATRVREHVPGGTAVDGMLRLDTEVPVEMTGAALIDERGDVVGLVNAMPFEDDDTHDGSQAIAAPIASVVAETMIGDGRTRHAWLGLEVADVDVEGSTGPRRAGVAVKGLATGGPAAAAGVAVGDVLVAVDDAVVASISDLLATLRQRRGGDIVTVDLIRDGVERRVEATLGARTDDD